MAEQCKSLALQFDLFIGNTLQLLNTATETDYMQKLNIIDELMCTMNENISDENTIKNTLEAIQDECSKLSHKLKTSARLYDDVQKEKKKLEIEREILKSQLDQLNGVLKKHTADTSKIHPLHSNYTELAERNTFNNTDALLSDLSYSQSEDSSYDNILNSSKPKSNIQINKRSTNTILNDAKQKTCKISKVNINGGQITATTTLSMDLENINAKSVIKTHHIPITKASSSSIESFIENEKQIQQKEFNDLNRNINTEHNFVKQLIVISEICAYCQTKIKFNSYVMKCEECNTVTHLDCKDFVPVICKLDQNEVNDLNISKQLYYNMPVKNQFQTPQSDQFSSGLKRRILDTPKKIKTVKQAENKT